MLEDLIIIAFVVAQMLGSIQWPWLPFVLLILSRMVLKNKSILNRSSPDTGKHRN